MVRFKVKIKKEDGSSVVQYYSFVDGFKAFEKGGIMHKYDNWRKEHPNEPCPEELLFHDKADIQNLKNYLKKIKKKICQTFSYLKIS